MGAVDVFSFGPWLFRGEDFDPYVFESPRGVYQEPRCAVGMFENGHYVAMMVEGRMGKESAGVSLPELYDLMRATGCTLAINLDGGQTAAFTFMGERITPRRHLQRRPHLPAHHHRADRHRAAPI